MRPDPLLQLSGVGLDPAEDGRVVNLHPAIEQHQFEIAVADRNIRYHRTAHRITSSVNCRPLNCLRRPTAAPPSVLHRADPTGPTPSAKPCNRAQRADSHRTRMALADDARAAAPSGSRKSWPRLS